MGVEEIIGYKFNNPELLKIALTHSSYAHENGGIEYNEKMEFLGDAVLELISSEYIFSKYRQETDRLSYQFVNRAFQLLSGVLQFFSDLDALRAVRLTFAAPDAVGRRGRRLA